LVFPAGQCPEKDSDYCSKVANRPKAQLHCALDIPRSVRPEPVEGCHPGRFPL